MSVLPVTVNELLSSLAEKGVQLWAEGEQLRVRAGAGILDGELKTLLKHHKPELLVKLRERDANVVDVTLPRITPDPEQRYEPFPLNDIQQAYWVGRTGGVELGNITTHAYVELEGNGVDVPRLSQALQKVIARQDMLRVMFLPTGEQQVLRDVPPYEIAVLDLREQPVADAEEALLAVREEMSHQVLPLDRWPLFDIRVSMLAGGRMRTHLSIDLLITDFGSLYLLMKEWAHAYERPDDPLPPLEISFRDFIVAEREIAKTELYKRSERYWLDRLDTLPPRPQLPLATNPMAIEQPRFQRRHFVLEEPKWRRLKESARSRDLTPSGLLLAAFAEVLELWSQSPRFTINLTQYNRLPLHPQVNEIIGNSISVVLLAVDNGGEDTFARRAVRLQQQLWRDLDHTYISGVRVIRELARKQGYAPGALMPVVFTSILGLEALGRSSFGAGFGEPVYTISQTPQVWLDHQVLERDGTLFTSWDAVEDLFPAGLLDEMFHAYQGLLERLVDDEELWSARQTLALPARQLAIRNAVNDTDAPLPEALLHGALERHAHTSGDAPAVITSSTTLAYRELFERSQRLGRRLRASGVLPNEAVAIVMEKGWEQIVAVMGILASGAAYMPIDPAVPAARLRALLERGRVRIALTQSRLDALQWPEGVERISVDASDLSVPDGGLPEPVQTPDDLAYVLFTSGSTGEPRGVMVDHRGPLNTALFFNHRFRVGPDDRALALSALNFDLSVYDMFGMCAAGGALVMPDPAQAKDPAHWVELMAAHRVTVWNSVPTLMRMLVEYLSTAPEKTPPGLRLVILSGDWIPVSLPDRIRSLWPEVEVIGAGGPTETSVWNIHYPIADVDPAWTSIPYGRPIANNRYHVLDERLRHRPEWVAGELVAEGVGLARGYWGDAAATSVKFVADPLTGKRLYKTGDLGRYLPDGCLEILGRTDFQVKIDGHRIELGEIEAALREHPLVRDAVVSAVGEDRGRRRLVAYVVAAHPPAGDSSERAQFKLDQHGLRPIAHGDRVIELPQRAFDDARSAAYQNRVSTRAFAAASVPLPRVGRLLDCLQQMKRDEWPLPKRLYPSAGSLYPVQAYLHVKDGRVEGLQGGTYYYDPSDHRLVSLTPGARIDASVHVEHNRLLFERAAFSLFLIAQKDAIVPLYGEALAEQFCLVEAGYMGQALMLSAHEAELGICPIGALDYDAVRGHFRLDAGHVFVHSFVGGIQDDSESRHDGGVNLEQELRRLVAGRLPDYMAPAVYMFLDALPLNANSKVDRGALPDPSAAAPAASMEVIAPRTDIERALAQLVGEVLGTESVGVHHTFFDLGGTSVDLVKIHNKIRERLARDIRVVDLFRMPTVALLAEFLAEGEDTHALDRIEEEAAKRRQARLRRHQRPIDDAER